MLPSRANSDNVCTLIPVLTTIHNARVEGGIRRQV
jgi:hypothetical protein